MLATLIPWYDKISSYFSSGSKTRDYLKVYRLSDATFYDHINTIYQFIKTFWIKKMSIFEDYGAFNLNGNGHNL